MTARATTGSPTASASQAWLRPPDGPEVAYEFFAPFAHVEGKYEWCRIRSPTHGVLDVFIVLAASTSLAADVYVNSDAGARFLAERYPECRTHRVGLSELRLEELDGGRTVRGELRAKHGPVRDVDMTFTAPRDATPEQVPYGGHGRPVWGGRFTCWGVDLVLRSKTDGRVVHADGRVEELRGQPGIVTLGSFGRIAPLTKE